MKKIREMKKNNKGFSLVELIVVIAIMVVLVAVLGSTILGYIDESKYSKDIQALDAVDTAVGLLVADPDSNWSIADNKVTTLAALMAIDENKVLIDTLVEVFPNPDGTTGKADFVNSSSEFDQLDSTKVKVKIVNGAVKILAPTDTDSSEAAYESPKGASGLS